MEILESDNTFVDTHNEEVLRRVAEMQELVENSEQYLNRHQRESSDSDGSHISSDGSVSLPPPPTNLGQLKHSDSLLLLAQVRKIFRSIQVTYHSVTVSVFDCVVCVCVYNMFYTIEGHRGQHNRRSPSIELGRSRERHGVHQHAVDQPFAPRAEFQQRL